jgi:hypothetical protein
MNISKFVAGAGVVLSLTMFTPALFAQTGTGTAPGTEASGSMANPATAGTGSSAMPSTSGSAASENTGASMNTPATENAGDVYSMETQLQKQINQLRSEGKSVSRAERHLREGELSLNKGHESTASKHFEMAQRELNKEEGGNAMMGHSATESGATSQNTGATENSGPTSATGAPASSGAASESGNTPAR